MAVAFGEFELDQERRQLLRSGQPVPLEPKAYELLSLLLERRPRALSRAQIRDVVWPQISISESTLAVTVNAIRQALGDDARHPRFIRTVHGFGYAFCSEVTSEGEEKKARPLEPRSPYPGLASFTEEDAAVFFGREAEVEALWERLERGRLLALIGPSGAGKTSFLRAGVIPARRPGWGAIVATPGRAPMRGLAQALAAEVAGDADAVRELLRFEDPDVAFPALEKWRQGLGEALLVVDQFEELFTLTPPETQARMANLLGRLSREADIHVLLSMRDDFLIRCQEHETLAPVFAADLTPLLALRGEDLRRAIVEPARRAGFAFEEDSLVEEMVRVVEGERGALPLLAFAVSRLWEKRDRERKLLTRAAYEETGGVVGALAQHAERTLKRIGPEREPVVRELFRNLVTAQHTRAAAEGEELLSILPDREVVARVLEELIDARLLTSYEVEDTDGHTGRIGCLEDRRADVNREKDAGLPALGSSRRRIEVVHESLLRVWPRLVRWQAQDEEGAVLRDQLRQAAHLWREKGRPEDLLWSGTSERELEQWRDRYPGALTAVEDDFAQAMIHRARRRRLMRRLVATSIVAAAVVVATVTGVLWQRSEAARRLAEAEARRREAAQILSVGRLRLEAHPTAALAHALASLERADNEPARRFAVQALWRGPMAHVLTDAINPCVPVWSPDGRWLAVGGTKSGLLVLGRDGGLHRLLEGALPVGFSDDSSRLVTKEADAFQIWALPGLERLETWKPPWAGETFWWASVHDRQLLTFEMVDAGPNEWPLVVRERPIDGGPEQMLGRWPESNIDTHGEWLVGIEGGRLLRWRLDALKASPVVIGRHEGAESLALRRGANLIATAGVDGEIRLWNADAGRLERTFQCSGDARGLLLDPSGRYLTAAPWGALSPRSLRVFDLGAPWDADPLTLLNDEIDWLNGMSFHPDGHLLASGHYPHGVLLWNLAARRSVVLRGQKGFGPTVTFTPDGRLVSTSDEGVVRLWPLWAEPRGPVRELRSQPGLELLAGELNLSPDGDFAVVLDRGAGHIIVLPLDGSGGTVHPVIAMTPDVSFVVPSLGGGGLAPDGRRVAVGYCEAGRPEAASILILDIETGEVRRLRPEPTEEACVYNNSSLGPVQFPHWLPDGRLVSDGTLGLRLWDLTNGTSQPLRACREMKSEPPYLAATPDSSTVLTLVDPRPATGETSALTAFDLSTRTSREITRHGTRVSAFTLDPTGTILVTGDMNGLVRVGPLSGGEPHLLYGHSQTVSSLAVSRDGKWIASASADETIRLWPMPDLSRPPLHTLPYEELLTRLRSFTNLRVVRDDESATGHRIRVGPFPGWKTVPTW